MKKIVDGIEVALTAIEIQEMEDRSLAHEAKIASGAWKGARMEAYLDKGWGTALDLLDDVLNRGLASVKSERAAIKAAHPKPENV